MTEQDPNKTDYTFAGGLSGVNPAELDPQDIQKLRDVTDQGIEALKHRYDNPNWFKVAAGFAKPTGGNFLASLGNALEPLGENVEQERANIQPVVNAQILREQSNMLLGQKIKQNQLFQEWRASGKPMDENTFTRISSLGENTDIAKSAEKFWEQAKARVGTTTEAQRARYEFPELDDAFKKFVEVSSDPTADPKEIQKRSEMVSKNLDAAKPPQTEQSTWNGMSIQDKRNAIKQYSDDQQKLGLTEEGKFRFAHDQAVNRLPLMETIRDQALGKGVPEAQLKDEKGQTVTLTGQQQMAKLLGMFGGSNPFEIIAKAANEGKFGELFRGADNLVRQGMMTTAARTEFESLVKSLAMQEVQFRNGAINPTNAYQQLQQTATPGVWNSQSSLVHILDLMAHGESNEINKYQHILTKPTNAQEPYGGRRIGADSAFYDKQREWAAEHERIARNITQMPMKTPDWYRPGYKPQPQEEKQQNPAAEPRVPGGDQRTTNPPAQQNKPSSGSPRRNDRYVGNNGHIWQRNPQTGKYEDTGENP